MPDTKTDSLFPLPMVAFERYMLADDRPEYPMTFPLVLRLSGKVDREAFASALDEAVERHPMLRALAEVSDERRPRWVLAEGVRPVLDWNEEAAPLTFPRGETIDLAREPGLRVWVRQGDDQAEVTVQFHHASCDGVGAAVFIGDLLACYAVRTSPADNAPALQPVAPERLLSRGAFGRQNDTWFQGLCGFAGAMYQAAKFGRQRPTPLQPPTDTLVSTDPEPFSGICRRELDETTSQRLREVGRHHKATVNDLFLRDMFRTILAWNDRRRKGSRRGWLRILMPSNLRGPGDERMPAANVVTMSFLSRRAAACDDAGELLRGVRDETESIKRSHRGMRFIRVIEVAQALCGRMPGLFVSDHCFTTVVLSNLGDITRWFTTSFPQKSGRLVVGNLVLEDITGVPPIRPKTYAAFLIFRYAGRTIVNLRCDPRRFKQRARRRASLGLHRATD